MKRETHIVWLRRDLRLDDNPALHAARSDGAAVLPLFIWSPDEEADWAPGAASRWWLHHSLTALSSELERRGSRLILRTGRADEELAAVQRESGATRVYWNRLVEPAARERDARTRDRLRHGGVRVDRFNGALLFAPEDIRTTAGQPFKVFTPFWKACQAAPEPPPPIPAPNQLPAPSDWPDSRNLDSLELLPGVDWAGGLDETWEPGETGAGRRMERLLTGVVDGYDDTRNRPDLDQTSRLSPHLHFGEIGPRRVWHALADRELDGSGGKGTRAFLRQVAWREFAHHVLYHFPGSSDSPLRPEFEAFPWRQDPDALEAWQKGQTGYPIVDAGMRELWHTGWMHNRVRMVVASFLVKDLLIPWQDGARWFWDTLVDADLANNSLGWQWTAGCGVDAAPYFRVFNPMLQGKRFDPEGRYVRRWVPSLERLPAKWLHEPWEAPASALDAAGVILGDNYPHRIVDHGKARDRALSACERIRKGTHA